MTFNCKTVQKILDQVKKEGRTILNTIECNQVCEAYKIPMPQEGLATSLKEAIDLAHEIGYPVGLKIASTDILHKTEAHGVIKNLFCKSDLEQAYPTLIGNARTYRADAEIQGVKVQKMLPDAQEIIIGAVTDPSFGKLEIP